MENKYYYVTLLKQTDGDDLDYALCREVNGELIEIYTKKKVIMSDTFTNFNVNEFINKDASLVGIMAKEFSFYEIKQFLIILGEYEIGKYIENIKLNANLTVDKVNLLVEKNKKKDEDYLNLFNEWYLKYKNLYGEGKIMH